MIEQLTEKLPANLRLSISNLWEKLGSTDAPLVGLAVSLTLAVPGIIIALLSSDPVISTVAAAWAILNLLGPIKWVFGL